MDRSHFLAAAFAAAASGAALPARAADVPALIGDDLVAANRILARLEVVDGFGHISARDPGDPQRYWLSRSMAPALVTADDLMVYDLQSSPVDPRGRTSYLERFIHGAIYRARPDVKVIVHAHTPTVIPFGVSKVALRPIYHMGAFLGAGVPVFDIREAGGDGTDLLVSNQHFGDALARKLGSANVALMRGHGMVAVAETIPEAVFRAYYTAQDAQLESEALRLGSSPNFLTVGEARAATQTQKTLVGRTWALWKRDLGMQ
jgi:ribulose-5-phosphate 4-epimerase/fuculose-1-phosphate aldolase